MLPPIPDDEVEEERLQRGLFIDAIRLAPAGAELLISSDSWDQLPSILGERMSARPARWVVALTPENRAFLVQEALDNDIQGTFVHFYIVAQGAELLASYDRMVALTLDKNFPSYEALQKKYVAILLT